MRRNVRWAGILIAVAAYAALTIRMNSGGGIEQLVVAGESATQEVMRPYWIAFYVGVALLVLSWFLPARHEKKPSHQAK